MARHLDLRAIQRGLINEKTLLEDRLVMASQKTNAANASDPLDRAQDYDAHERKFLIRRQMKRQLALVEAALARLEAGTYGSCVRCHQQINPQRLLILPATPLCFQCRTQQSKETAHGTISAEYSEFAQRGQPAASKAMK